MIRGVVLAISLSASSASILATRARDSSMLAGTVSKRYAPAAIAAERMDCDNTGNVVSSEDDMLRSHWTGLIILIARKFDQPVLALGNGAPIARMREQPLYCRYAWACGFLFRHRYYLRLGKSSPLK